eukprot:CAMPEP_0118699858 /NCGR_PEP_ID=MMETSP0800-20121206/16179_1 /TAXON_ID=210618 ORGANISM="Striatella unipunctata, Strain CCMP2910" /NCGR_SAMPLE_ID=MMETSP0800 /ASSEMBLY_ACC=CAM_ASM_000638 /LENGTH=299 /DNA_ID=CAMNT_0006600215 /DNA_START=9 /DNA_END=908 /DNA_ORIENTATION=-
MKLSISRVLVSLLWAALPTTSNGALAPTDALSVSNNILETLEPGRIESLSPFVRFSIRAATNMRRLVCSASRAFDVFEPLCTDATELVTNGQQFKDLPEYFYANFLALTIAYPIIFAYEETTIAVLILFPFALRLHRTLGYGNSLRMLGYSEATVERAYWDYWNLLTEQDLRVPDDGPGVDMYCNYIDAEYELFKTFYLDNYGNETGTNPTLTFNISGTMYRSCSVEGLGYFIRSDWEHHRREIVSAMMASAETSKAMVLHSLWHWESLFVVRFDFSEERNQESYSQYFESFEFLRELV